MMSRSRTAAAVARFEAQARLAGMLLPALSKAKDRGKRLTCVSHLRQHGLAYRMWAYDTDSRYPWRVEPSERGSRTAREAWQHFVVSCALKP